MDILTNNLGTSKEDLFNLLRNKVTETLRKDPDRLLSLRTKKGNTQSSERECIQFVKDILDELLISYEEASSQQPKDFRNVGGIDLQIEIKKTDGFSIKFNDTCPSPNIYYIVFFTGKEYKQKTKTNLSAQCLFLNGRDFLEDSEEWISEYMEKMNALRDEFCRGVNKEKLTGGMSVYARPNFTFKTIRNMLDGHKSSLYRGEGTASIT